MSNEKDHYEVGNFKALYNKKYGDLVSFSGSERVTPEQLFDLAVKYFTWAEENAIKAAETAAFQGVVSSSKVNKPRVFTISGLALFCCFTQKCFSDWRKKDGYADVMSFIDSVIYEQKFQLAVNGIINSNFAAKEMGIDKPAEVNVDNSTTVANISTEQFKDAVNDILGEL